MALRLGSPSLSSNCWWKYGYLVLPLLPWSIGDGGRGVRPVYDDAEGVGSNWRTKVTVTWNEHYDGWRENEKKGDKGHQIVAISTMGYSANE